jgi:hypothetical protein
MKKFHEALGSTIARLPYGTPLRPPVIERTRPFEKYVFHCWATNFAVQVSMDGRRGNMCISNVGSEVRGVMDFVFKQDARELAGSTVLLLSYKK